jgi:hypothetical protein
MSNQEINPSFQAMAGGSHGLLARTYYRCKPFIPKSVRWILRRSRISRIMRRHSDVWPISSSASGKPDQWKSWPHGKQFALVFTHDVESSEGVHAAPQLAELEIKYGIQSSFYLIPEGQYEDPVDLRNWLVERGFEIGVHDLNHDGQLYESRESFSRKAKGINHYLKKWNAVGFRSGFMLHQLDWLHELNILYDASTFDTDPFEPQPDGTHTIFPFLITHTENGTRREYVELSYTLPQDSTLFLLLQEKSARIWKEKLAWLVQHGGLALVNIHPDYIDFSEDASDPSKYPVALIEDFLVHVRDTYGDAFWNPRAKDLAQWYLNSRKLGVLDRGYVRSGTKKLIQ